MSKFSQQSLHEPAWHSLGSIRRQLIADDYAGWLSDAGSLTSKLISTCHPGKFSVRLLRQNWLKPLYSESRELGMRHGEVALVREVQLMCEGSAWVFARTLIPASSFTGRARRLAYLGNRPLGALLFADPTTVRKNMQFARLAQGHQLFNQAITDLALQPDELWGRRTLFYFAGQPLLVNEIFLPEIPGDKR